MDALYPRLLVTRFAECFGFYGAILPPLTGATLVKGAPEGPYANWDVDDQAVLVLFDRAAMAATLGTTGLPEHPAAPAQDSAMLVLRVDDVDKALALCLDHGGTLAVAATDRPEWGPNLRSAHLRDPEGHLIELQSY
ncbi:glyoxalase/bleomycin resistance/extradiol dioxygenase family protein [Streptomyces kaniharaensis]|uniref:Glyoxalase/bleomycin resistance/extradiol dioxygenase family protein n=1 Tax=Streptomyces kaniharaensis TaxID=212423 RepID=A0A6N7KJH1_9ACTN|nr:VOC family protein [Streptomyces kaniharaensis]MQS10719.1 glyoxalase/bleomycin resistance/extradiol dioxygenase family protein [Streptomyces kaniharaensis]